MNIILKFKNIDIAMKKLIIFFVPLLLLIAWSCTDTLNVDPRDRISSDLVWENEALIRANLTDLYASFPHFGFSNNNWYFADEATNRGGGTNAVTQGLVSRTNDTPGYFNYNYIRQINEFIENVTEADIDESLKSELIAEARVIRAVVYFEKQKRYGGVPLVDVVIDPYGDIDEQYQRRATEEAIADFISTELNQAAEQLSTNPTPRGQINRWTALAYKARANLWAASIAQYGDVQLDGVIGIPSNRMEDFYTQASLAADEVIQSGAYTLYSNFLPADPAENYRQIFIDQSNNEVIFEQVFNGVEIAHSFNNANSSPRLSVGEGATVNPLFEFVMGYENIDGSDNDPPIGPDHLYENGVDLFASKDPRLRATVMLEGETWAGYHIRMYDALDPHPQPDPGPNLDNILAHFSLSHNGVPAQGPDGRNLSNHFHTQSGFMIRKHLLDEAFIVRGRDSNNWITLRLAEMYLIKAESEFELGNYENAATALNATRERAGISLVDEGTITLDHVRTERRSELAFEGHRYWDLRRWRIAQDVLNRNEAFKGMHTILHYETGHYYFMTYNAESFTRSFRPEHYYNPITDSRIENNPYLIENPGY
jgi:starch-binding outer membrane protein, SusD/RagB family